MKSDAALLVEYAARVAFYYGYVSVSPYWLVHAGASCDDLIVLKAYKNLNINIDVLRQVQAQIFDGTISSAFLEVPEEETIVLFPGDVKFTDSMNTLIDEFTSKVDNGILKGEPHELLILASKNNFISHEMLALLGTTAKKFTDELVKLKLGEVRKGKDVKLIPFVAKKEQPNIQKYCKELSRMAENGELDPVIGREKEIERVIQVLGRRRKNNPVILGEAGTGKTAIAEGIALAIFNKERRVKPLWGKRIVMLDLHLMLAGTTYRGQYEERITGLLQELEDDPDTIVFIDELHNIVGAGKCEGSTGDAANIIKPALARGRLQVIGATTKAEYGFIKKDPALERRFQPVELHPLTENELYDILKNVRKLYEEHHNVKFPKQTLLKCIELAKNIPGRQAPDIHIDLLDEAGSRYKGETVTPVKMAAVANELMRSNQTKSKKIGF